MKDRTTRIDGLLDEITMALGGKFKNPIPTNISLAEFAKADLCSATVREFPNLQGGVGASLAWKYFAPNEQAVCDEQRVMLNAIYQHYGPAIEPRAYVWPTPGLILADRMDTLWGFFAAGEKPSGSRDPYALRRAALIVIRILQRGELALGIKELLDMAKQQYSKRNRHKDFAQSPLRDP